jgi:Iap family predicted aminopeptidase
MEDILRDLSVDEAWRHLAHICREVPERLSGTPEADRMAAYLLETLEAYGVETILHEFPGLISIPQGGDVRVLAPESLLLDCAVFAHSASTLDEGIEADLVYVRAGSEADYRGRDVRGKIVLAELSYAPARPEKTRIAIARGAVGLILMNWGPSDNPSIPMGTVKYVWGNPTVDTIHMMPSIPAVGIRRGAGEHLRSLLDRGPVRVRLRARATREWKMLRLPIGIVRGGREPDDFVLVAGHYDAWGGGATDNATGCVSMLEIARVLQRHQAHLARSVYFAFWPGHENGIMEGSTWFADHYWDRLRDHCVGHVNIDSPGMVGTTRYLAYSSSELLSYHREIEQALLPPEMPRDRNRLSKIGDQSFMGAGIPSIFGLTVPSEEQVREWHGAFLGPYYQSTEDTIDKVDPQILMTNLRVHAGYVLGLATRTVLPYDFTALATELESRLTALQARAGGALELAPLVDLARRFATRAAALRRAMAGAEAKGPEAVRTVNTALRRLSQILMPVSTTVAGRWEQDTYGLSALHEPIPSLEPVEELAAIPREDTHNFTLLYTKLIRRRNQVADALDEACREVERLAVQMEFAPA